MDQQTAQHRFRQIVVAIVTLLVLWAGYRETTRVNERKVYAVRLEAFLQAMSGSQEAIAAIDVHDKIVMASVGLGELLGNSPAQLTGKTLNEAFGTATLPAGIVDEGLRESRRTGQLFKRRFECTALKGNTQFPVIVQLSVAGDIGIAIIYPATL